jgi:hypothetical protein
LRGLLLDDQAQVLAHSGRFFQPLATPINLILWPQFARPPPGRFYLDAGVPYDYISFFEPTSIYCLTHVGYSVCLVSVVLSVTWDPERQWKLQRAMREAVLDFRQARPDWAVPPPATDVITPAPVVTPANPGPEGKTQLPDLEAIFGQGNPGKLKPEDIDAYWEAALGQSANLSGGMDGISFEQARQMGLAPKDD